MTCPCKLTYGCMYFVVVAKLCPTLMTPWTIPNQAPLPMGFSRQEYLSGLPFPTHMQNMEMNADHLFGLYRSMT